MGGLEGDLFSSKFHLTGTEGSEKQEKKKKGQAVGQRVGEREGSAARGAAFPAEMSES